jgi:ATP:ADP antiporter, AAA family
MGREGVSVRTAALAAGLLIAQQVAVKVVRDGFYLSQFPVSTLPVAVSAGAVLSLAAVVLLSRGMGRVPPARLLAWMLWSSAALLVAEWALSLAAPRLAAAALYGHVAILGTTAVSGFWAMVNEAFDPHAARRAMGRIGTGASIGGVLGAALTWRASVLVPTASLLLGVAALVALCAISVRHLTPSAPVAQGTPGDDAAADPVSAGRIFAEVPYLRSLAALVALCALLEALLDYTLSAAAVARFGRGEALVGFFAAFQTSTGVLSLLVQAALVRWSLARLGLAWTLAVHPLGVALLAAMTAAVPRLGPIAVLRGAETVLRHSVFRSAYELLYTPLPPRWKRPTKPLVDVGSDRVGTIAGGLITAAVLASMGPRTPVVLVGLAMTSALAMSAIALRFHRAYVTALVASLRAGSIALEQEEVQDATTRQAMDDLDRKDHAVPAPSLPPSLPAAPVESPARHPADELRSGDQARIRAVLAREVLDPALVAVALPLLRRDELFGDLVPALRRAAPHCTGQLVDALLDDRVDPVIRRRIPRVLASVTTQRAVDGLCAGLDCDRLDVRYRSAQALVRLRKRGGTKIASEGMFAVAAREIALLTGGGARLEHVFAVLSLALDGEPIELAFRALQGRDAALRGTALEYLDHVLPPPIRAGLWPRLGADSGPSLAARRSVDEVRQELSRSSWRLSAEGRARGSAAG